MKVALSPGDICSFKRRKGVWGYFIVLAIDKIGPKGPMVYSLGALARPKFPGELGLSSKTEVTNQDTEGVQELLAMQLNGHFPVMEKVILETNPKIVTHRKITKKDLGGYHYWMRELEKGNAGVFSLSLDELF